MKKFKNYIIFFIRIGLGIFFLYAAVVKISNIQSFAQAIRSYELIPAQLSLISAIFLPWIELYSGLFILIGLYTKSSGIVALSLMTVFTIAVITALMRGLNIDCGCGASIAGLEKVSWLKLLENVFLIYLLFVMIRSKEFIFSVDQLRFKSN